MDKLQHIFSTLQQGGFIILQDDANRENEADLVIAAEHISQQTLNFMLREAGGFVCVPMAGELLDKLHIPMMVQHNTSQFTTPFTMTVEAANGVTTGVSVADRVHTIKTLVAENSTPSDLVMPGHISPLRANAQGVLGRPGHTEGSIDLMRLSGLREAAVICELMHADGTMLRGADLEKFAAQNDIPICSTADIRQYRLQTENVINAAACCRLPMESYGEFRCAVYIDQMTLAEHIVLSKPSTAKQPLVRIHSQCFTGDVFQSQRCDCGAQLQQSMTQIAEQGGVLIYLAQEGRGIGLVNKIKAYALQEKNYDTVDANLKLGLQVDLREYYPAAHILRQLGLNNITLLTNNPEKVTQLTQLGITVERKPLLIAPSDYNKDYLFTKQAKLHHLLNLEH